MNGMTHYFLTMNEIVIPFEEAKDILLTKTKNNTVALHNNNMQVELLDPEYIIQKNLSNHVDMHFNGNNNNESKNGDSLLDEPQTGVVVLLGHFDHGKVFHKYFKSFF